MENRPSYLTAERTEKTRRAQRGFSHIFSVHSAKLSVVSPKVLILTWLVSLSFSLFPQTSLSLEEAIFLAQHQSIEASQANNLKTTEYWQWRSFKANYKPQITWNSTLPSFNRTSEPIIQDDGTISFLPISQSNVTSQITLSQQISLTGGTLFLGTDLQRFDNLNATQSMVQYNASPVRMGIIQPLFEFNQLKWDKKTEPLRYQESLKSFHANMEGIAVQALDLYFSLMLAQIDLQIARVNLSNTDTLYQITEQKYRLGKVSDNDLLQLKLENLKAAKSFAVAEQDVETASRQLNSYMGNLGTQAWDLLFPNQLPLLDISSEKALQEAYENRPDGISFHRRTLEAERDVAKAKGQTGFSANLQASFGWVKSSPSLRDAYRNPTDQQGLMLVLTAPILDWGRAKSQTATAKANQQLILDQIAQDQLDFEQNIRTQITLFHLYQEQISLNQIADSLAQKRYQIAQERYLLGDLSITDFSLALQEKDQSKRDYIQSLWNYWKSYYRVRELTLYDFYRNEKITYTSL